MCTYIKIFPHICYTVLTARSLKVTIVLYAVYLKFVSFCADIVIYFKIFVSFFNFKNVSGVIFSVWT